MTRSANLSDGPAEVGGWYASVLGVREVRRRMNERTIEDRLSVSLEERCMVNRCKAEETDLLSS